VTTGNVIEVIKNCERDTDIVELLMNFHPKVDRWTI